MKIVIYVWIVCMFIKCHVVNGMNVKVVMKRIKQTNVIIVVEIYNKKIEI
jgi:hypothetical protein